MLRFGFLAGVAAVVCSLSAAQANPAQGMNDWYRVGYTEGWLQKEKTCTRQMQVQSAQIIEENARLRQEIAALREQMQQVQGQNNQSADIALSQPIKVADARAAIPLPTGDEPSKYTPLALSSDSGSD